MIKKFTNFDLPFTIDDVRDFTSDFIDNGDIDISDSDPHLDWYIGRIQWLTTRIIYHHDKIAIGNKDWDIKLNENLSGLYFKMTVYHPKRMIKGSLDLYGYTYRTAENVFKRFMKHTNDIVDANLFVSMMYTNKDKEPLSESIVKIEFDK